MIENDTIVWFQILLGTSKIFDPYNINFIHTEHYQKLLDFASVYHAYAFVSFLFFLCPQKFSPQLSPKSATKRHIFACKAKRCQNFLQHSYFFAYRYQSTPTHLLEWLQNFIFNSILLNSCRLDCYCRSSTCLPSRLSRSCSAATCRNCLEVQSFRFLISLTCS